VRTSDLTSGKGNVAVDTGADAGDRWEISGVRFPETKTRTFEQTAGPLQLLKRCYYSVLQPLKTVRACTHYDDKSYSSYEASRHSLTWTMTDAMLQRNLRASNYKNRQESPQS
jgi:hypothetical protein